MKTMAFSTAILTVFWYNQIIIFYGKSLTVADNKGYSYPFCIK